MSTGPVSDRIARARRVLERFGVLGAQVEAEGTEQEIAAIRVPADAWEQVRGEDGARIAAEVRNAGFRYVALDLRLGDGDAEPSGEG
jgi:PP-loop superfamily ATP-utilizing enzyme